MNPVKHSIVFRFGRRAAARSLSRIAPMNLPAAPPPVVGSTDPADVAAGWLGTRPLVIEPLAGAGLSGAPAMVVRSPGLGTWVLKRVATAESLPRAAWVHALVGRARARGVRELPGPATTPCGATLVGDGAGGFWELVAHVAGAAVEMPDDRQVAAAMAALARVHTAWGDAPDRPGAGRSVRTEIPCTPPPAVARRIAHCRGLAARSWSDRRAAVTVSSDRLVEEVAGLWDRALRVFADAGGRAAVARVVARSPERSAVQPVIRDIWYRHLLFAAPDVSRGDAGGGPTAAATVPRVAAIVDLHGSAVDTPATDIARLAGSWWRPGLHGPCNAWLEAATEAYADRRPLSAGERALVPWLHASGVLCGLDNWFRWVVEEGRRFAAPAAALERATRLLEALPEALEWLAR